MCHMWMQGTQGLWVFKTLVEKLYLLQIRLRDLSGLFCARANVKVHTALAFLVDTLTFGVVATYSTFTMCLHTRQYLVVPYN